MKLLKTPLLTKSIIAAAVAASGISVSGLASSAPNVAESRRGADKVQLVPARQEYPNVIESIGTKYTVIRGSGIGTNTTNSRKQLLLPEVDDEVLIVGRRNNPSLGMAGKQPGTGSDAVGSEPLVVSPPFVPRPLP